MNRKAQTMFTYIIIFGVFLLVFAVGLGAMIKTTSTVAIEQAHLTGTEAFFYDNLVLWILLISIIALIWWLNK